MVAKGAEAEYKGKRERGRQHLTEQKQTETGIMRETVVERRMRMSLLQETREDAASAGVAKPTRLDLRYPRQ